MKVHCKMPEDFDVETRHMPFDHGKKEVFGKRNGVWEGRWVSKNSDVN